MSVLKRLLPYVILNILISIITTIAVLTWWNSGHAGLPTTQAVPTLTPPPVDPSQPAPTAIPAGVKVAEIAEVNGPGNLNAEQVLIRRLGEGELNLNGWRLDDNAGHRFTFPDMVLFKGGSVRVSTRAGTNTVNDLFWGQKETVWASGKTAGLYDSAGVLRASFSIP